MFEAKLIIDGSDPMEVLQCRYALDRDTDQSGMPSTGIRGGKIDLVIKSSSDYSRFDWIINPYAQKDGEIQFFKRNDPTPAKTLSFKNSYIIEFGENFNVMDGDRDLPMTEHFTVSAEILTMEGSEFTKEWVS